MSLEKWVEYGWLRREPTSPDEIRSLLGIVERSFTDAKVGAVSTDLRFVAAFNAALCVATIALRATSHRTVTQAGHHVKTIESLERTLKPNANAPSWDGASSSTTVVVRREAESAARADDQGACGSPCLYQMQEDLLLIKRILDSGYDQR